MYYTTHKSIKGGGVHPKHCTLREDTGQGSGHGGQSGSPIVIVWPSMIICSQGYVFSRGMLFGRRQTTTSDSYQKTIKGPMPW